MQHAMRLALALALTLGAAAPARADALGELEQDLALGDKPASALQAARDLAAAGHLLEALSTSERVLFLDRKSGAARLLHATLLCRLDDPLGAAAEFSLLNKGDFKKADWQAAMAQCPALTAKGGK